MLTSDDPLFPRDENLLDEDEATAVVMADIIIEIALIQWAAEGLRDITSFLGDLQILDEKIPLIDKSVNTLIAGPGRTLADLFDFTGKIPYLVPFICTKKHMTFIAFPI